MLRPDVHSILLMAVLWAIAFGIAAGAFRGLRQGAVPLWLLASGMVLPAVLSLTDAYFSAPDQFEGIRVAAIGAVMVLLSALIFLLSLLSSLLFVALLRSLSQR